MQKIIIIKPAIALSPERACTIVEQKLSHMVKTYCSYLSHFPSIEKVFHDKQIQFLFSVVLRVLVPNSIHSKDFGQCCGLLIKKRLWVRSLYTGKQSNLRSTTVHCSLESPVKFLCFILNIFLIKLIPPNRYSFCLNENG